VNDVYETNDVDETMMQRRNRDVVAQRWNPDTMRMALYRSREVAMAMRNIQTHCAPKGEDDTLHSRGTIINALKLMGRVEEAERLEHGTKPVSRRKVDLANAAIKERERLKRSSTYGKKGGK
jgi:hypothetical protein